MLQTVKSPIKLSSISAIYFILNFGFRVKNGRKVDSDRLEILISLKVKLYELIPEWFI